MGDRTRVSRLQIFESLNPVANGSRHSESHTKGTSYLFEGEQSLATELICQNLDLCSPIRKLQRAIILTAKIPVAEHGKGLHALNVCL